MRFGFGALRVCPVGGDGLVLVFSDLFNDLSKFPAFIGPALSGPVLGIPDTGFDWLGACNFLGLTSSSFDMGPFNMLGFAAGMALAWGTFNPDGFFNLWFSGDFKRLVAALKRGLLRGSANCGDLTFWSCLGWTDSLVFLLGDPETLDVLTLLPSCAGEVSEAVRSRFWTVGRFRPSCGRPDAPRT